MSRLPGYAQGAVIACSSQTTITRAIRESDGRQVVLKQPSQMYPASLVQQRLVLEYDLLRKLVGPGVIEALELVEHEGRQALVLEDFHAASLALPEGEHLALGDFLDVALQVSRALGRVHACGVLHKDIKPHNLLRNPETLEVKLIDFQLATELSRQMLGVGTTIHLEGSLPYISPEQTGRMNRTVDYRSDYYSLGVALFELLTGQLPLQADTVMGWVHAHISRAPRFASTVNEGVPPTVARIVERLMAKDPAGRYQSMQGLIGDLERCQSSLLHTGAVAIFEPASSDFSERFQVSERLVGRRHEIQSLRVAFEKASTGGSRLLLVKGQAGVGKSSLIQEIHRPATERNAQFVSGKFDQLERNVPYGAVVQAVSQLVRGLLVQPDDVLEQWRLRIRSALGENAQLMVELVPELGRVLGQTEAVASLNSADARNRLHHVFACFIGLFASVKQPLVVFLDDLQWTDASTPALLVDLLVRHNLRHVLLIGAFRDDEVSDGHPLFKAVREIESARAEVVSELCVGPLTEVDTEALVAESLQLPSDGAQDLARLVYSKTQGNPFFTAQLLEQLHRIGAITLDAEAGSWSYDLRRARDASVSDNVVELLLGRLATLEAGSRNLLSVAACMGNQFDLVAVAQLLDCSLPQAAQWAWPPTLEGLIVPLGDDYRLLNLPTVCASSEQGRAASVVYRFQHDRVQQACYSLIDPADRARVHLRLGRRLAAELDASAIEERIFEVVNHFELGVCLIDDPVERCWLKELNVRAANRALRSTAYDIASRYLSSACRLLEPELGSSDGDGERFRLRLELAGTVLMAGSTDRARQLMEELAVAAPNELDRAAIYLLEARILEAQALFVESVAAVRRGLALLGVSLPEEMTEIEQGIGAGIGAMQAHFSEHSVEQLAGLPTLEDPRMVMAMNLLFQVIPAAIQTCPPLFLLAELRMFHIAVAHGVTAFSAKNLVDCGIIQGGIVGNYERAYQLGKVAFRVLERFNARSVASSVNFVFATYVSSWRAPCQEALAAFDECIRTGIETGDIQHVGFGTALRLHRQLHVGHDLEAMAEELQSAISFLERSRLPSQRTAVILNERAIARLCSTGRAPEQVREEDELATKQVVATKNPQWIYAYGEAQLMVSLLLGELDAAERWRQFAKPQLMSAIGLVSVPEFHLCEVLLLARHNWAAAKEPERKARVEEARALVDRLKTWAENSPENFAHKYHLAAAEVARVEQAPLHVTLDHYRKAADLTGSSYVHLRALAYEMQANYWKERGHGVLSNALLTEARDLFSGWGAHAKALLLSAELGGENMSVAVPVRIGLGSQPSMTGAKASRDSIRRGDLDLESVVQATRVLASAVRPGELYASLMAIMLENAAAQRGVLVLVGDEGGQLVVEACARSTTSGVALGAVELSEAEGVCAEMVRYVVRSGTPLVIDDAREHELFGRERHVVEGGVKSVLCLPVTNQGKLLAVFYAENNAASCAFPARRVEILVMIAGQAAVSIANAKLYQQLEAKVEERTHELATKNREIVAMLDGMEQGVFSVDAELRVLPQLSRQARSMLGVEDPVGQKFVPLLFAAAEVSSEALACLETSLQFSFGFPAVMAQANREHFITEYSKGESSDATYFEIDWNPVEDAKGLVEKFLVVVRDVTETRRFQEKGARLAREGKVVQRILAAGVEEFRSFCDATAQLLDDSLATLTEHSPVDEYAVARLFRNLHTIKGNGRTLGLCRLVEVAHAAEGLLEEPDGGAGSRGLLDAAELVGQLHCLRGLVQQYEEIGADKLGQLWVGGGGKLARAFEEIESVLNHRTSRPSYPASALEAIQRTVERAHSTPLQRLVEQLRPSLASLAEELNKPVPRVQLQGGGVWLTERWSQALRDALTHSLRNSLDHGLEMESERLASGKPPSGCISVDATVLDSGLCLRVRDDGRGLALQKLRRDAESQSSDEQLAERIFESGVSTKDTVTTISGRGAGMDVVRTFVREQGGDVRVQFTDAEEAGYRPFELVFRLPLSALAQVQRNKSVEAPVVSSAG